MLFCEFSSELCVTADSSIAVHLCNCFICSVLKCVWLLTRVLRYSFVIILCVQFWTVCDCWLEYCGTALWLFCVFSSELRAIADPSIAIHLWRSRLARFFLVHFTRTISRWSFSTIDALGTITHYCCLCKIHLLL